ncbi:MAG: Ig-like domain-containing protein [Clostridiales bacterium]|jgi:uncharacterized protein YjdB|nr:Ig-like domain-containing protein [Clostridiales bacterium]
MKKTEYTNPPQGRDCAARKKAEANKRLTALGLLFALLAGVVLLAQIGQAGKGRDAHAAAEPSFAYATRATGPDFVVHWNNYTNRYNFIFADLLDNRNTATDIRFMSHIYVKPAGAAQGYTLEQYRQQSGNYIVIHIMSNQMHFTLSSINRVGPGATVKFLKGFEFLTSADDRDYWADTGGPRPDRYVRNGQTLSEDVELYVTGDGTFVRMEPAGSPLSAPTVSVPTTEAFPGYYSFNLEYRQMIHYGELEDAHLSSIYAANQILFNGYSIAQLNAANPQNQSAVHYADYMVRVWIHENTVMDGKSIFLAGHENRLTVTADFVSDTGYVPEADYVRYYYPEWAWWAARYEGKPDGGRGLDPIGVSAFVTDAYGNISFTVRMDGNMVETPYLHINGIPSWLATTPYAASLDPTIINGSKNALLDGLYFDGYSIRDYMAKETAGAQAQSEAVMVHFETKNTLTVTFQKERETTPNINLSHTVKLDADVFYSPDGNYFNETFEYIWTPAAGGGNGYWRARATGIELNAASLTMFVGDETALTATVKPSFATERTVEWRSNNRRAATVDENGTVAAVGTGVATVYAVARDGEHTATCAVTVYPAGGEVIKVTGVSLSESAHTVASGGSFILTASVLPENATIRDVSFSSSNPLVASVEAGVVTGRAAGAAYISVTTAEGAFSASCRVTVEAVRVKSITLDRLAYPLAAGADFRLTVLFTPAAATNRAVFFESEAPLVASVSADGTVTGLRAGTAAIRAYALDGYHQAVCTVIVTDTADSGITALTLSEKQLYLKPGATGLLTAEATGGQAGEMLLWESGDESVAVVKNGVVTALKNGTATITVKNAAGAVRAECAVTVSDSGSPGCGSLAAAHGAAALLSGAAAVVLLWIKRRPADRDGKGRREE